MLFSKMEPATGVELTIANEITSLVGFRSVPAENSLHSFVDSENVRYCTC